jgi:hypothetical protein
MPVNIDWGLANQGQQTNPLLAYMKGQELGAERRKSQARNAALARFATDPDGAIAELASADPEAAMQLDKVYQSARQRSALTAAQPKLAAGDFRGAGREAMAGGNLELAKALSAYSKEDIELTEKLHGLAGRTFFAASQIADPEQRKTFLAQKREELRQAGADDNAIARYDAVPAGDPNQLKMYGLAALDVEKQIAAVKPETLSYGQRIVSNPLSGPPRELYVAPDKVDYVTTPPGGVSTRVGGGFSRGLTVDQGGMAPPMSGAPQGPGNGVPAPAMASPDGSLPIDSPPPAPPGQAGVSVPIPAPQGNPEGTPDTLAAAVTSLFPGARISSTLRSPAHNAEVGGVPNSRHLQRGGAVDFVPPQGVSMAEAAAQIEARYGGKALNEGDHVHWQPAEALSGGDIGDTLTGAAAPEAMAGGVGNDALIGSGGPGDSYGPAVIQGPPKVETPKVAEPPSGYRFKPGGDLEAIPGGPADKGVKGAKLAPQHEAFLREIRENANTAKKVATQMTRFVALNESVATGPNQGQRIYDRFTNPRFREMESIRDELTPLMRQGLPGAASDRDVAMFQSAAVSTDKFGDTNTSIAKAANAYARRQQDYVAFMEHFARENGTVVGGQEEWEMYASSNPLFSAKRDGSLIVLPQQGWRQWFGIPMGKPRVGTRRGPPQGAPTASKPDPLGIR